MPTTRGISCLSLVLYGKRQEMPLLVPWAGSVWHKSAVGAIQWFKPRHGVERTETRSGLSLWLPAWLHWPRLWVGHRWMSRSQMSEQCHLLWCRPQGRSEDETLLLRMSRWISGLVENTGDWFKKNKKQKGLRLSKYNSFFSLLIMKCRRVLWWEHWWLWEPRVWEQRPLCGRTGHLLLSLPPGPHWQTLLRQSGRVCLQPLSRGLNLHWRTRSVSLCFYKFSPPKNTSERFNDNDKCLLSHHNQWSVWSY